MKKIITLDSVMVSFIAAMGYGFGYVVPEALGLNMVACIVICLALGTVLSSIAGKIIFNPKTQKNNKSRFVVFVCIALIFLAGYVFLYISFGHSLFEEVNQELIFSIALPVVMFFVTLAANFFKRKKLLKKYGTGEYGFRFDEDADKQMRDLIGNNAEVSEYRGKDPVVKTVTGSYIGKDGKTGVRFLGIPYATAERWKKPMPLAASEKIYEAYYFGCSEIQPESIHNMLCRFPQSEDCLNLNIWTAKLEPESKKPVFVYIHGGDGRYGGSVHPGYHLENLANSIPDAVFVSINYRLGVFGVVDFSASGCPDDDEYADSTALSLLDQIEALKWIKANISAFGGDPDNITVAGDDAGGSCICLLSALKEAKGLFKRALILCASTEDTAENDDNASIIGKMLLEEFQANSISELITVSADKLRDFSEKNYALLQLPPKDGRFVPQDIEKKYLAGAAADIEFIFGIAADNSSGWQAMVAGDYSIEDLVDSYYEDFLNAIGIDKADKIETLLQKHISSGKSVTDAKRALLSDFFYKAAVLHNCDTLTRGGSKVRCFYWDVEGNIEKLTANSASLVTAILGNSKIAEQMGYLNDQSITEIMQAFVGKFIHGKPLRFFNNELDGFPEIIWEEFDAGKDCALQIKKDAICMTEKAFFENVRELGKLVFEE